MKAVVLTLSGKDGGVCLAVYSQEQNRLRRLVSDDKGSALPINYKNSLKPLDEVEFTVKGFSQNGPQKENIVIDTKVGLKKIGKFEGDIESIYKSLYSDYEKKGYIFSNSYEKLQKADLMRHSLEICKVSNLVINRVKRADGTYTGKADFDHNGCHHKNYSVTDFDYDVRKMHIDSWLIGDAYIVVSLPPEPFIVDGNDYGFYKFVSAIYEVKD